MASSKKDIPNSQPAPKNTKNKANNSEDEINLIDYFRVVWRWKYFIMFGAVLPALLVCSVLFFSQRDYKITYTYDIRPHEKDTEVLVDEFYSAENLDKLTAKLEKDELSEKDRKILLDRFYSKENLDKLAAKLRENGFDEYAQGISKAKIKLEVSDTLLTMTVVGRPLEDMQRISSIIRDNFENVIPIYSVKQELSNAIVELKTEMADIEENRYSLDLDLEKKRAISAKLKNLTPAEPNKIPGGIILHFDNIGENSEYLPLSSQIQATESKIISLEETIKANQEKYNYYTDLLSLNESLFDELKSKTSSYYDIREFYSFLTTILGKYEGKELMHYLKAYIKRLENAIFVNTPIVEKPRICPIPKGTVKKSAIVFLALLMAMTFAAFLLEAVKKSPGRAS